MLTPTLHDQFVTTLMTIRPNAQWALRGDSYDGLEWLDQEQSKPTAEELGL